MGIKKEIIEEESGVKDIYNRILNRDFSGNSGQAIKNSVYQFSTSLAAKFGSLFFTILIARILMPELFGLYSLTLATIILFSTFSNFGEGKAILKFVSGSLGEKKYSKAKVYIFYLLKIKFALLSTSLLLLLVFAKFLSNVYYQKPIFLALLAGVLYIFIASIITIVETILQATGNFKSIFFKEVVFQILRLIIVPLTILLMLKSYLEIELIMMYIILLLSLVFGLAFLFLVLHSKKSLAFLKYKKTPLNKNEKRNLNMFIIITSVMIFSGVFLGYIDMFMLGHFVEPEFIGYYQAAFSLVGSLVVLIPFSIVLFPIFSRIKGRRLERGFSKSLRLTLITAIILFLCALLTSEIVIRIIYGVDYISSVNVLRVLALLILFIPLSALYESYFISQGKVKIVATLLISTTILNILLNYFFITWLLTFSQLSAIFGASMATILSRGLYLLMIFIVKTRNINK